MKNLKILGLVFITVIFLQGCVPTSKSFYQLYKTDSNDVNVDENGFLQENEDIKVIYNLWNNYGNSGFLIFNKTGANIYIDLKDSHFIVNGIAKTYFQNRTFSESSSSSLSVGNYVSSSYLNKINSSFVSAYYSSGHGNANYQGNTTGTVSTTSSKNKSTLQKGTSVTYMEKNIVCIPPNSAKIFDGFNLNTNIYRDCDLIRFPSKKIFSDKINISVKKFNKNSSPYIFRNIISYYSSELNNKKEKQKFETNFWVTEIINYPSNEFYESKKIEFCGEKSYNLYKHFNFEQPNRFYIKYKKGTTTEFKH